MGVNRLLTHDLETIVFKILNSSAEVKAAINGGIYKEAFRPSNSGKQDISLSVLDLTQDNPQIGICNINVYTQDLKKVINNSENYVPNTVKLEELAVKIKSAIEAALTNQQYSDIGFRVDKQKVFKNQDTESKEHFNNLRIEFLITNN